MLALLSVYLIWGSTYFALAKALVGFPPFWAAGTRYVAAGLLLLLWGKIRNDANASLAQISHAAVVGCIMGVGGNGGVTVAQSLGVTSSVVAMVVSLMPIFAALWNLLLWREKPLLLEWIAMALAGTGAFILLSDRGHGATPVGLMFAVASPILWSLGSMLGRRWDQARRLPAGITSTGWQLLSSGLAMCLGALVRGETFARAPTAGEWMYWAYLVLGGSVVAFSAYMWLLRHTRPAVATSYAFVNPLIATALGVFVGHEPFTQRMWLALPLVVVGVALAIRSRSESSTKAQDTTSQAR